MSDAPPSALSSGVASRFVSSTALEEAKKKREEEWKAAYERIGQAPPQEVQTEAPYDGRSLWEKLQENKDKKQEAFDEQIKFKNQFRALDEDEISFLDSMIDEGNDEEKERKRQELEDMKGFRAAVTKRAAPPAPPAVSPPLASTSTASPAPLTAPAPAKAAAAPKKGKKKTLPGVVVGKKKASPAVNATAPAAASPASATPTPTVGTKRAASTVESGAAAATDKEVRGEDGEGATAKKRKTEEEKEVLTAAA
ncbi:hypothetical protein JCM11641_000116 [Rhodosporidiobolus odoratus]